MSDDRDLQQQLDEARAEAARYEQLLDGSVIVTAEAWEQAQQAVEAVKRVRRLAERNQHAVPLFERWVSAPAIFRALDGEVSE